MKRISTNLVLASFLSLVFSVAAHAQSENTGWYAGISGGLTLLSDSDISASAGPPAIGAPTSITGDIEFDPGFAIGVQGGYKWPQGFRGELEYRYTRVEADKATVNASVSGFGFGTVTGDIDLTAQSHAILGNLWYDWDLKNGWMPYVGGGLGAVIIDFEDTDNETVFGWQAGVGIQYAISKNVVFDLGYRWLATLDPEFESGVAGVSDVEAEYSSHNFMIGVRGHF